MRRVGEETFRLARSTSTRSSWSSTDEICAAIQDIFEDTRAIAEPAGALAVAGLKQLRGARAAARAHLVAHQQRRQHELRPPAPRRRARRDRRASARRCWRWRSRSEPGSFLRFCQALGQRSVTEFNYRYDDAGAAPRSSSASRCTRGRAERAALIARARGRRAIACST